jgi:hypothetical protein
MEMIIFTDGGLMKPQWIDGAEAEDIMKEYTEYPPAFNKKRRCFS